MSMLKVGFDMDGLSANFNAAFIPFVVAHTGRDLFHPEDVLDPPVWDYPELRGYTHKELNEVWRSIATSDTFWFGLQPLPDFHQFRDRMTMACLRHDAYFITSRPGRTAKKQTERWLTKHLGLETPTVLIAKDKGLVARALHLNAYIDDKFENAMDVAFHSPGTRSYLYDRAYNRLGESRYHRVASVVDFFDREGL